MPTAPSTDTQALWSRPYEVIPTGSACSFSLPTSFTGFSRGLTGRNAAFLSAIGDNVIIALEVYERLLSAYPRKTTGIG
ncbi:MAG: hypothetical protein ACLTK0_07385 [Anaerovoracaceae bacterium]